MLRWQDFGVRVCHQSLWMQPELYCISPDSKYLRMCKLHSCLIQDSSEQHRYMYQQGMSLKQFERVLEHGWVGTYWWYFRKVLLWHWRAYDYTWAKTCSTRLASLDLNRKVHRRCTSEHQGYFHALWTAHDFPSQLTGECWLPVWKESAWSWCPSLMKQRHVLVHEQLACWR